MKKDETRVAAAARGDATYVPAAPCARGHFLRKTASGNCVECRRIAERLLVARTRDAYNARKRRERAPIKAQLAEKARHIRASEDDERRAARLEKARISAARWRSLNAGLEQTRAHKRTYKARNPDKTRADTVLRRISKLKRTPSWLSAEDYWMIEQAYDIANVRTRIFGFCWHVDHIIPLQGRTVSGLHVPQNLQVIPWLDNVRKANRHLPA